MDTDEKQELEFLRVVAGLYVRAKMDPDHRKLGSAVVALSRYEARFGDPRRYLKPEHYKGE